MPLLLFSTSMMPGLTESGFSGERVKSAAKKRFTAGDPGKINRSRMFLRHNNNSARFLGLPR
jgi:hypothetical protein